MPKAFDRYLRYLMVAVCFRGETAADEHRRAARRALARDAGGAVAVLEEHIGGCVDYTLSNGAALFASGGDENSGSPPAGHD